MASRMRLSDVHKLPKDSFYIISNGKIVRDWEETLTDNDLFQVCFRVLGGKGGFGSLLRSFRIYRSTDQDMCRDLSGRRVKDVEKEKKLKKWISQKAEREADKERKRQEKYLRLKQGDPKHTFNDPEFSKTQEKILEKTEDAIEAGLKAAFGESSAKPTQTSQKDDQPGPSGTQTVGQKRQRSIETVDLEPEPQPGKKLFKVAEIETPEPVQPAVNEAQPGSNDKTEKGGNVTASKPEAQLEPKKPKKEKKPRKAEEPKFAETFDPIDLEEVESVEKLMEISPEALKYDLHRRGLKCGGTPQQRADRLWAVRGMKPEEIPKNLKAK